MESRTEFKLKSPPSDAVSAVEFGPNSSQFLLVSSWDSTVRLYDIQTNTMRLKYTHDLPVLDIAFQVKFFFTMCIINLKKSRFSFIFCTNSQDAVHAYSGGLGNTLKMYDINTNTGKTFLQTINFYFLPRINNVF